MDSKHMKTKRSKTKAFSSFSPRLLNVNFDTNSKKDEIGEFRAKLEEFRTKRSMRQAQEDVSQIKEMLDKENSSTYMIDENAVIGSLDKIMGLDDSDDITNRAVPFDIKHYMNKGDSSIKSKISEDNIDIHLVAQKSALIDGKLDDFEKINGMRRIDSAQYLLRKAEEECK